MKAATFLSISAFMLSFSAAATTANIDKLSLVDMKNGEIIAAEIDSGATFIFTELENKCLSVRAHLAAGLVKSVGFEANGNLATENKAPYDLMGDNGERGCLTASSYTVHVTPYSGSNKSGAAGTLFKRSFTIKNVAPITNLSLIDMKSGEVLASSIDQNSVFNFADLSNKCLSVRAEVGSGIVKSVGFDTALMSYTEGIAPYDMMGDDGERGCLKAGSFNLKVTPFSDSKRSGTPGTPLSRSFTIQSVASVTSFSLVDKLSGKVFSPTISPGDKFSFKNLDNICLGLSANVGMGKIGSVLFKSDHLTNLENKAPYELKGDGVNGCLRPLIYHVTATPFAEANKEGVSGIPLSRSFEIQKLSSVTSVSLIDSKTGQIVSSSIPEAMQLNVPDLSQKCLKVRANLGPGAIGSLFFESGTSSNIENNAPYEMRGDGEGGCLKARAYSVKVTPYSENSKTGTVGDTFTRTFTISSVADVSGLSLIDSASGAVINSALQDGEIFTFSNLAQKCISVRANLGVGKVGSVFFEAPTHSQISNSLPYDYKGLDEQGCLSRGTYSIKATPFSEINKTGVSGSSLTRTFTIREVANISGLSLIDLKSGEIIASEINDSAKITIPDLLNRCLTVRANAGPGVIGSVAIEDSGKSIIKNNPPYDYSREGEEACLKASSYTVKATPFSEYDKGGVMGLSLTRTFSISTVAPVTAFSLVDIKNGEVVTSNIEAGAVFKIEDLENKCLRLSAAVGTGTIGSLFFESDSVSNIENKAPYDMKGDGEGGCLKVKSYTVKATPYSEPNKAGTPGPVLTRTFTISNPAPYVRKNLLVEETFDRPLIYPQDYRENNPAFPIYYGDFFKFACQKEHSFQISTDIKRKGKSAARFETRTTDKADGIIRSEAMPLKPETHNNRWYGLSMYLPKEHWNATKNWNIITQFWSQPDYHLGEGGRNPPIEIMVYDGKLILEIKWNDKPVNLKSDYQEENIVLAEDASKLTDQWIDFVWHIEYSYEDGKGTLELWINGEQKVKRLNLPNRFNDAVLPYFKFGLYNYARDNRVIYVDEVRVGNEHATYRDVAP